MELIHIKESDAPVIAGGHFTFNEFYKPLFGTHGEFDMPLCFVNALEVFRKHIGLHFQQVIPLTVTSVYRPADPSWSPHKTGNAVDFESSRGIRWAEVIEFITNEMKNWANSEMIQEVLQTGTTVILHENGCIHIS